jgi:hypothetical protein
VVLQKIAPNTVELVGAKGSDLTIAFSTARDLETDEVRGPLRKFVGHAVDEVADAEQKAGLANFLEGVLERALADSHGTILICVKDATTSGIPDLQDAVELTPELDFLSAYSEYKVSNSAESLLRLQSLESLLRGLLQSDGILVVTRKGSVCAYRGFYRPSAPAAATSGPAVVGGARRRAFEGIGELVGSVLTAALFRSQDGQTKLKEAAT